MFFRQKRVVILGAVLLAVVLFAAGCGNQSAKAVAQVNGEAITRGDLDSYMNILRLFMPNWEPMLGDKNRRAMMEPELLDALIENVLVRQAATELGIEVTEEEKEVLYGMYKVQMIQGMFGSEEDFNKKLRELALREADLRSFIGSGIYADKMAEYYRAQFTEEEIRSFIAEHPEFGTKPVLFTLSHILLETEEEAREILARLAGGEDFADLAEELSLDPRAQREGHTGYRGFLGDNITQNSQGFWPEFFTAVDGLQENEISEPVETSDGWHIVKLRARTEAEELPFADAQGPAGDAMAQQAVTEYLDMFFAQAQIEKL